MQVLHSLSLYWALWLDKTLDYRNPFYPTMLVIKTPQEVITPLWTLFSCFLHSIASSKKCWLKVWESTATSFYHLPSLYTGNLLYQLAFCLPAYWGIWLLAILILPHFILNPCRNNGNAEHKYFSSWILNPCLGDRRVGEVFSCIELKP